MEGTVGFSVLFCFVLCGAVALVGFGASISPMFLLVVTRRAVWAVEGRLAVVGSLNGPPERPLLSRMNPFFSL